MEAAAEETQKDAAESMLPNNSTTGKSPSPPSQETTKKSKKEDRNKRDDKSIEQFMKSLNSVPLEEKVSVLCKKYVQLGDDNKKLQFYIKQSDKRYVLISKEKEQLQLEYNKTVLVKSKLENLCRELQKQNRAIKDESILKLKEEEERRKETHDKFQKTLAEITTLLQQNNEKNTQLRDDNISMNEKFKSVVQQYQLREEQVEKMAKQMALESQLSDAKLQKASLEHQAERERLLTELEHIKVTMSQYRAKIAEMQGTEENLRTQLAVYTEKYNEFQNALMKSNQFYGGFKEQMELMSKKIKKLEKESLSWKKRWETSQTALIDMCGERQASVEKAAHVTKQLAHMQGLCRTLQAERSVLLNTLKDNNIERPPLPTPVVPLPPPVLPNAPHAPASNAKVDAMAANCAHLKQSLAHLQSQLNVLTSKQQQSTTEEPPKQEKAKKTKSKKNKDKQKSVEKTQVSVEADSVKAETSEIEFNSDVNKVEVDSDIRDDKVDDKTLETLIQAINSANINLCDLEVGSDDLEILNVIKDDENDDKEKILINVKNEGYENVNNDKEKILNEVKADGKEILAKTNDAKENTDISKTTQDNKNVEVKIEEESINARKNDSIPAIDSTTDNKVPDVNETSKNDTTTDKDEISITDTTSNEEISHIAEVKPISNE